MQKISNELIDLTVILHSQIKYRIEIIISAILSSTSKYLGNLIRVLIHGNHSFLRNDENTDSPLILSFVS